MTTATSSTDFDQIAADYVAMWNAGSGERHELVAELCADDVRYTDPLVDVSGRDALEATIGAVQEQFPGFRFTLLGAVDAHHEQARFGWELGPAGIPAPVAGFDVVTTDAEGKVTRVLGFLGSGAFMSGVIGTVEAAETPVVAGVSVADQSRTVAVPRDTVHWPTLLVVLTGVFMSTLDVFIVNVAIPSTQHDLHASDSAVQWIIAGFGLAVAAGVIVAGRLGDMFGRRRMFTLGLALFTLASAVCGIAPTASTLIGARVMQGLAAALLTPQVLAILGTAFRGRALMQAFTAYGLTMGLAAIFGQLIGGALIQANLFGVGWRSCFLINVPVGIAAVALVPRVVPESATPQRSRLDWIGTALLSGALVAVVLPLIQGRQQGWPLWTAVSFGVGTVLLADFLWYERRIVRAGREPLINPSLFAERAFSAGMVVQLVAWTGQLSFFLVFAVYVQNGIGLTPLHSGVLFVAIGAGYVVTAMASGAVAQRLGRQTVALGAAAMIGGLLLLDLGVHHIGAGSRPGSVLWLVPGLVVDGAGMGFIIAPMASLVLARVAPKHAGTASGVLSMIMQLGGALGVALIGIIFYGGIAHPNGGTARTFGDAFTSSSYLLIAIAAAVLLGIQLLPRRAPVAQALSE